jgi:hypothetical protein
MLGMRGALWRPGAFRLVLGGVVAAVVLLASAVSAAGSAGVDLTRNASTVLGANVNPGFKDAFGQAYTVQSRVTAVRFHNGSLPSTAPGGLVSSPHPVLKQLHGVSFFQVTGELSGVGQSDIGFEYVYGPIDSHGVDQSANPSSPRFGLRGIAFRLTYPQNWNGHLVVYRPPAEGGRGSGHYLYQSILDEVSLLRKGYGYFTTLGGGTTPPDSNPDSTSGLFWRLAPPYWRPDGPTEPDFVRAARIGPNWQESLIPDSQPGLAWFVGDPAPVSDPIGSSSFADDIGLETQNDVPTLRDHINVAKNLLELLTGRRPSSTGLVVWSNSGRVALGMDLGRTNQEPPSVVAPVNGLWPRTGGDYNTPYDPSSGRLVDWFLLRSGVEQETQPLPPDGHPDYGDVIPDPEYPIAAPLTFISAEVDIPYIELNGYYLETVLAAALPGSKLANKDINNYLRLYSLPDTSHEPAEAWFAGPYNGGSTTWFQYAGAGLNTQGLGRELPAWMDSLRAINTDLLNNGPYGLDPIPLFFAGNVREQGFTLQAILNSDRWATNGIQPPTSAVDANLVVDPSTQTQSPPFPVSSCDPNAVFNDLDLSCLQTLTQDAILDGSQYGPFADEFEVALLKRFDAGPLHYTTDPILLPDAAVPVGYRLYTNGPVLMRLFTKAELKARYQNHAGYVAAVTQAVNNLENRGLYDTDTGATDIQAAQQSSILK